MIVHPQGYLRCLLLRRPSNYETQLVLCLRYFEEESAGTVPDCPDPFRLHYDVHSDILGRDRNVLLNFLSPLPRL